MTDGYEFTEDEVRKKLEELGYSNIPYHKLRQFQRDLRHLIESEKSELLSEKGPQSQLGSQSSVGDSCYSDSSLRESDHHSTTERHRFPLEDAVFTKRRLVPHLTKYQMDHPSFGKENAQFLSKNVPERLESSSSFGSSPREPGRPGSSKGVKRKVLRRRNGEPRVFDESLTGSESVTDISDLEQRLQDLPIHNSESDDADVISVGSEECTEPQDYRPWEQHAGRALPSFIRPSTRHPHTKQIRKCDPVSRYHQFKCEWQANKAPGEKSHKNLRWNVRGRMLQCDIFEKQQRNYAPNNYVVPTEKKRQALRWEVRSSLARI